MIQTKTTKIEMCQRSPTSTDNQCFTYSDNIHSQDYVTQFINMSIFNYQKFIPETGFQNPKNDDLNEGLEGQDFSSCLEQSEEEKKTRSNFHNFQKHLVTTLRNIIQINQQDFNEETRGLQLLLWDCFLKSTKMTRTLIFLVFGTFNIENAKARRFYKQYGLQKVLKNYSQSMIRKSQRNLRMYTLKQIQNMDLQWEIGNRRMKNKEQFKVYFNAFVEELKQGGFNKRIPKQKRIKLMGKGRVDFEGLSETKA